MRNQQANEYAARLAADFATALSETDSDSKWLVFLSEAEDTDGAPTNEQRVANEDAEDPEAEAEAIFRVVRGGSEGTPSDEWAVLETNADGSVFLHVSETLCFPAS